MAWWGRGAGSVQMGESGRLGVVVLAGWALLCAVWNICGAVQIAFGMPPLGPGTTPLAAVSSLLMASFILASARQSTTLPVVMAILSLVLAGLTVWNAFNLQPALWPSEFWLFVAVALNALGIGGAILVLADATHRHLTSSGRH